MKTAIVYYSLSGNCAYTAEKIAAATGADLICLETEKSYPDSGFKKFFWGGKSAVMGESPALKPYDFDADDYTQVVFGFPVWAGTVAPPIRTFIKENGALLESKKLAAFACMSGAGGEKAIGKLRSLLNVPALRAEMVLIDPKEKPKAEDDALIREFCEKLQ